GAIALVPGAAGSMSCRCKFHANRLPRAGSGARGLAACAVVRGRTGLVRRGTVWVRGGCGGAAPRRAGVNGMARLLL
ncbi:hypothetical protein, partial [Achromobacter xylosoxidans]|uniref:hypothetical protein n=1 Tax=Alcaligenes xylosoxydans xylosoxydans TaxID=85698 RepID=UPI001F13C7F4